MSSFGTALGVLRAAADPTRLRILLALERRPLCVCELVALVEVGQPAVSRHLGILQRAGLIRSHRDGWWVEYRLVDPEASALVSSLLAGLRAAVSGDAEAEAFFRLVAGVDRKRLAGAAPARSCTARRTTGARR
ncbi:MAG: winged helix-turn-helix transcriptional regulator [Planctomycetes bacterium]|nr:winged helix-turn-helix transcriptional regulator [Planctomycetota bacterium]